MQPNGLPSTILQRGIPAYGEGVAASAAIMPGHLVAVSGVFRTVGAAPSVALAAAGSIIPTFALENPIHGIRKVYDSGENVPYIHARRGDVVLAYATGAAVVAGAKLYAVAGGTVSGTAAAPEHQPIGTAAGPAANGMIIMEII